MDVKLKYRRAMFGALAVLLVVGLLVVSYWPTIPDSPINAANAAQIQPGMTRADVEAVLGGPPGVYGRNRVSYCFTGSTPSASDSVIWFGDELAIVVQFDSEDRVAYVGSSVPMRERGSWY